MPRQMPEIGDVVLAGDPRGGDHAFDATLAESPRHDDPVELAESVGVESQTVPARLRATR